MIQPDFKKGNGLLPVIVQDWKTNRVLMLAYMDFTAWNLTLESGKASFFSRSRNKSWIKGEQSGNFQIIKDIFIDCDEDTILLKVEQVGDAACHLGYNSCFFRRFEKGDFQIEESPIFDPKKIYNK